LPVYKQPKSPFWLIEFRVAGRRFRRSAKTTSKREAQALERKWREQPPEANHEVGPSLALGEALERYFSTVVEARKRPKAAKRERYLLDRIKRDVGADTPLLSLTAEGGAVAPEKDLS
jgi:hypothetical protein